MCSNTIALLCYKSDEDQERFVIIFKWFDILVKTIPARFLCAIFVNP